MPTVTVSGAAQVTIDANLKFAGQWRQSGGVLAIEHGRTLSFSGGGSSFLGLLTRTGAPTGKGAGHLDFTNTAVSFDYFNGATISGLVVDDLAATFQVGAAGATIASGASLTFGGGAAGILGLTGSDGLTNNGYLLGAGRIGEGQMGLVNNGAHLPGPRRAGRPDHRHRDQRGTQHKRHHRRQHQWGHGGFEPGQQRPVDRSAGGIHPGRLTVSDGTRTARIALTGDYLSATVVSAPRSGSGG